MRILLVGLNHRSAPIAVREKLAFDSESAMRALKLLCEKYPESEFGLLSTCNRVELYCVSQRKEGVTADELIAFLSEFHKIRPDQFREYLYKYTDENAVKHFLTVTSSLDSMVVGEPQIIAQVKDSYRLCCSVGSTGKILNRLFHCAFTTGKKVHSSTAIAQGRVSVAGVAIEQALEIFGDISGSKVVVIGAGKMSGLLVKHLLQNKCSDIVVVNRSFENGLELARKWGVEARKWEQLEEQLVDADIIVASAAVQDYLFGQKSFEKIMARRKKKKLLVIDIAVPRNFDPSVSQIEGLSLFSIDDLYELAGRNRRARQEDIAEAMEIVQAETANFMDWFAAREIGPMIGQLEEKFTQISRSEMKRFFVGVRKDAECREVLENMVMRITNKLMHCVIKNVDDVARENGTAQAVKIVDRIIKQAEAITSDSDQKVDIRP